MEPEQIENPVTETPVPATRTRGKAAAPAPEPVAEPQIPDFDTALAALSSHLVKGTPEYEERLAKLRSHQVVAGVAGSIAASMRRADDEQARLAADAAAAAAREKELLDLAENDPEEFAARFRTQAQADKAKQELENLRSKEEQRIAGQIGLAARDLPELQDLTVAEQRKIADRLAGVPADRVLGAYNTVLIDVAADRRASARLEAELPVRVAAEREAWAAESNAGRLRTNAAPGLGIAARPPTPDEPDFRLDPVGYLNWINNGGRNRLARG